MLRRNLGFTKGLVNGAIGHLKDIIFDVNNTITKLVILVKKQPTEILRASSKFKFLSMHMSIEHNFQ